MKNVLFIFALFSSYFTKSQDFTGFNQSNYAGVTGVYQQPASVRRHRRV